MIYSDFYYERVDEKSDWTTLTLKSYKTINKNQIWIYGLHLPFCCCDFGGYRHHVTSNIWKFYKTYTNNWPYNSLYPSFLFPHICSKKYSHCNCVRYMGRLRGVLDIYFRLFYLWAGSSMAINFGFNFNCSWSSYR